MGVGKAVNTCVLVRVRSAAQLLVLGHGSAGGHRALEQQHLRGGVGVG